MLFGFDFLTNKSLQICETSDFSKNNIDDINLFNQNFNPIDFLPKNFLINASNRSYKFNADMLQETSSKIESLLKKNSNCSELSINIVDNQNIMEKFERIYQMEQVTLYQENFSTFHNIRQFLNLKNCIIPSSSNSEKEIRIGIDKNSFYNFLQKLPKKFCFVVKNQNYFCNNNGVYSSNLIRNLLEKDPNLSSYSLDLNDGNDSFQTICDFFNYSSIRFTLKNVYFLKEIAERLNIVCLLGDIYNYIMYYEYSIRVLIKYSITIDSVEDLFQYLYNRKKLTPKNVSDILADSVWCQTEDNVREMAACIIQVIYTDVLLHPFLMDLIELLDEKKSLKNELKFLLPSIVKKLIVDVGANKLNCAFIYRLAKKKIISLEDVIILINEKLEKYNIFYLKNKRRPNNSVQYNYVQQYLNKNNKFNSEFINSVLVWFIPELIDPKKFISFCDALNGQERSFIQNYASHQESYIRMRDSGEPDDVITQILRKDDVDSLQSYLLTNESKTVPFNIFESFIRNGTTNFIDYAAAYGSVKCFKYLLDNKHYVSTNTLSYAVFGQSKEIIELTDQILSNPKKQSQNTEALKTANTGSIEDNQNSKQPSAPSFSFAMPKPEANQNSKQPSAPSFNFAMPKPENNQNSKPSSLLSFNFGRMKSASKQNFKTFSAPSSNFVIPNLEDLELKKRIIPASTIR